MIAVVALLLTQGPAVQGLDHIPIAVRDLEKAAATFRKLGFTLKAGRPHANGIRNRHVKFADGTELELITAGSPTDDLTTFYTTFLKAGDGPAFTAYYAPDQELLTAALEKARLPFVKRPYTVAVRDGHVLDYIFFGGRNISPTDKPEHYRHKNGAISLIGYWLVGNDLQHERKMLVALGGRAGQGPSAIKLGKTPYVALGEHRVYLHTTHHIPSTRRIAGAVVKVKSLPILRRVLKASRISFRETKFNSVLVRTSRMWLEFRASWK